MLSYWRALSLTDTRSGLGQLWYAPILTLAIFVMMARLLVLARVLTLEQFGIFNFCMLSSGTFCMFACAGLQMVLQREWPKLIILGFERRGLLRAAQCNIVSIGCGATGAVAAMACSGFWPPAAFVALGLLHGVSQQLFVIASFESRSRGMQVRSSNQNLARAVALFLVGVVAAILTRSAVAVIVVEASVSTFAAVMVFHGASMRAGMREKLAYRLAFLRLPRAPWQPAFVLMIVSVVMFLVFNLDRWIAADWLGAVGFARYSFAWIVLSAAQSAQAVINAAAYPMLARRVARGGHDSTRRFCALMSVGMLVAGALAVVPAWVFLRYLVSRWYPQYSDTSMLILIFLGVAVFRVSDFWSSYLLVVGRERVLLACNAALSTIIVGLWAIYFMYFGAAQVRALDVATLAAALALSNYVADVALVLRTRII